MEILKKQEYQQIKNDAKKIKYKINSLLKEKKYVNVCKILDEKWVFELSGKNAELFVLQIMKNIQIQEQTMGMRGIFYNRNINEIVDIYESMVLLLRRIEFDFPQEYQEELLYYMNERNLSWVCAIGVIQGAPYLLAKEEVIDKVQKIFTKG